VKGFIRELRRREVFRTAGLYVGISWILIEAASILLPTFDMPEWVLRAIVIVSVVGFPVMLALAWFYNLTEHGLEVQADPTDTVVAPLGSRKMDFAVIGVLTVALIFSVYMNLTSGPSVVEEILPVSVLIADFDNMTGDEVFDGSLEQALQIGIEGAPFVTTYQRSAARRIAKELQPDKKRLDEEAVHLIAVREGITIAISGSIEPDGDGYTLTVRALETATGEPVAEEKANAGSKADVLAAVGSLSGKLREALGDETIGRGSEGQVETFTATSIEAVRDYTRAQDFALANMYEESLEFYEAAVQKDPKFGRALSGWALSLFTLGRMDEATALWERALANLDTMTQREQLRTLGLYYMVVTGNYQKAIENYQSLVENYPADNAGYNNLAIAHFATLDFASALDAGGQALDIYPTSKIIRSNYALYAMYAGDFQTAIVEAQKTLELDPKHHIAWLPIAMAEVANNDLAASRHAYDVMSATSQRGQSVAGLGHADLAIYAGEFDRAVGLLERGIEFDRSIANKRVMATKQIALAEAYAGLHNESAANDALAAALETGGLAREVPAALIHLRLKNPEAAMAIAASLGSKLQAQSRAYALMIDGMVHLQRGDKIAALDKLRAAIELSDLWLIRYHLGRAYLEAGYVVEAMDEFSICEQRRGEATAIFLDDLPTWRYMATLPYWLGRTQLELGMRDAGSQNLQAFLALRPEGGPLADDARNRLP